jgi:phosphatidate cytidylyltransferase
VVNPVFDAKRAGPWNPLSSLVRCAGTLIPTRRPLRQLTIAMNRISYERLFGLKYALDSGVVRVCLLAIFCAFLIAPVFFLSLRKAGKIPDRQYDELWKRYRSWLILVPMMAIPVLLGAFWTIMAVGSLSILCYREYARATGLFRERLTSLLVALGILAITFSVLDHWYGLFTALFPLWSGLIVAVLIFEDRPQGYIQRVSLAILALTLFGVCLGHLGYFANDPDFRPILFWLVVCVEVNDIFAYLSGKTFGRRRLAPHTSPNKTLGGSLGALILTTALAAFIAHFVFRYTPVDQPARLILLGLIISASGQLGDLLISSIKRDLNIKDMGVLFPGHGGWLDRFDSLLLAAPAVFHYVGYFRGIGLTQPTRILSGS